jgi:hypothetical protein
VDFCVYKTICRVLNLHTIRLRSQHDTGAATVTDFAGELPASQLANPDYKKAALLHSAVVPGSNVLDLVREGTFRGVAASFLRDRKSIGGDNYFAAAETACLSSSLHGVCLKRSKFINQRSIKWQPIPNPS